MKINNTFTQGLQGIDHRLLHPQQIPNASYAYVAPKKLDNPRHVHTNHSLVDQLGLTNVKNLDAILTGQENFEGFIPFSMNYAGHQFGHWAGQLGDGRAIIIGELSHNDKSYQLQLKGAGLTPFSRSGDGNAVLRSTIREYLCSEAMYHLGIPTTRSLSMHKTGELVMRDIMYNGNAAHEQGALMCRVSSSFIRFGNFQLHAARKEYDHLRALMDFTIEHHYSHLSKDIEGYIALFKEIVERTMHTVMQWQRVGFVHGVMNTDNMSILGETIDYGPYGWIDAYDRDWTPNTTDLKERRYRFGNQPNIAMWNLVQLANAFMPIIQDQKSLEDVINKQYVSFTGAYISMMYSKLGIFENNKDDNFIYNLEQLLHTQEIDMTLFFRNMSKIDVPDDHSYIQFVSYLKQAIYSESEEIIEIQKWKNWFSAYRQIIKKEDNSQEDRSLKMNTINPSFTLRNYITYEAIEKAEKGDYTLFQELFDQLQHPYIDKNPWFKKAPKWAKTKVGCSMLSCSS